MKTFFTNLRYLLCNNDRGNKQDIVLHGRTTAEESVLDKARYFTDDYFSHSQFISFAEQVRLVHSLNRKRILEIGIGNGIVSEYLKKAGLDVTTFDINPNLKPDIVGNVAHLDEFGLNRQFDIVLCAEVLEHTPFSDFHNIIQMISKITNEYAIITIPRARKTLFEFQLGIKLPKIPYVHKHIIISFPKSHIANTHHWELDSSKQTSLTSLTNIMNMHFTLIDSNSFRFRSRHYYFILKTEL